jgi:hypothetical protein
MFQLVESPTALPGCCYLCGSGDKAPYIDWGVSIDFHGALYTCSECTGAVASLLGYVPREVHDRIIDANDELISRNLDLEINNRELTLAIEHLRNAGFKVTPNESVLSHDIQPPGTVADVDSDILANSQDADESSRETDELLDFGKRTSDESSDDKGVDKLHSNESIFDLKL